MCQLGKNLRTSDKRHGTCFEDEDQGLPPSSVRRELTRPSEDGVEVRRRELNGRDSISILQIRASNNCGLPKVMSEKVK